MKSRLIPLIIMLVAGLSACIVCILYNRNIEDTLLITLMVLIIFYIIGNIAKKILEKVLITEAENIEHSQENSEGQEKNIENININFESEENFNSKNQ